MKTNKCKSKYPKAETCKVVTCQAKECKIDECKAKQIKVKTPKLRNAKVLGKEKGSTSGHLPWCLGTSERTMAQTTVDTTKKKTRRWGAWTAEGPKPCVSLPGSRSGWGKVGG